MGDTHGMMKTRGEWTDAVTAGETDLTHAEWYRKKMQEMEEQSKQANNGNPSILSSLARS
jgi:hypothetical protein